MATAPSKKNVIFIGAFVALAAALYFGWQWADQGPTRPIPAVKKETPVSDPNDLKAPLTPTRPTAPTGMTTPATQLTTVEEGDLLIDEILRSEKEIPAMAKDLHELVKKLNGEAQVNASRHLINLTSDDDYGLIAGFLVDNKMNPEVIEVLFSDLMNRKRELQMPLFMNILKNPAHPQNEQVRNVMTILAGEDFGQDFGKWDQWATQEIRKAQGLE